MARKVVWKGDYEITGKAAQSQRGSLEYARNNNKAWYAPDGNNDARNWKRAMYLTRSKSGKLSFQFHDKCVTANTPATKANQATFGANAAILRGILGNSSYYLTLSVIYQSYKTQYKSFNAWIASIVSPALVAKGKVFSFHDDTQTLTIANPWQYYLGAGTVEVPGAILRKFAQYLAAISLTVDGAVVAAYNNSAATWGDFVASSFNDGSFTGTPSQSTPVVPVLYKGQSLFTTAGEIILSNSQLSDNVVVTTPPNS